ncbi:MAG: (d)CMP kinase [Clostridia bacterium]
MNGHLNIAIDGPAGAGKSTVAKAIAQKLGIRYLDTGAMYRAMALYALRCGVNADDADALARILPDAEISVKYTAEGQRVLLGNEDVTGSIRTPEISMGASRVSAHPCVREKLAQMQRQVAEEYDVVMDGRDITTNVLPNAPFKFYVTASPEERARRRLNELTKRGETTETLERVLADIEQRDYNDTTRAYMPLRVAEDATVVDTSEMSIDQVLEFMTGRIGEKGAK